VGGAKNAKGAAQSRQAPPGQINRVFGGWVKGVAADPLVWFYDGGHPRKDAAGVAHQLGRIPCRAVRYRSLPVGPGQRQETAGVVVSRREQRRRFHVFGSLRAIRSASVGRAR
jgi:hypothetical protein